MATKLDIVNAATGAKTEPPQMDDNHWNTLQELLNAVNEIPGVFERVEAFMIGRGIESPKDEIEALHKIAFA